MALSLLLLIICAVVLFFLIAHSKYGIPLFFLIIGIILTTITVLFQYFSSSSYIPPSYLPFRNVDIYIYRLLGRGVRMPMTYMQRIRNCGIALYIWGCALFTITIRRNRFLDADGGLSVKMLPTIMVPALLSAGYCLLYSPITSYKIFLHSCVLSDAMRGHFALMIQILHRFMNVVILCYIFSPLIYLGVQLVKKQITLFQNAVIILSCTVGITNIYFYLFLFVGIFRYKPEDALHTGFWFFNTITKIPAIYIASYPLFALAILLFTLLSINTFFSRDLVSFAQDRLLRKRIDDLNGNLRDVFHSEKNLMFSINILAHEVQNNYGSEAAKEKLDRIIAISQDQMNLISSSLDSIKQLHIKPDPVDIKQLTDRVLNDISIPDNVTVEKNYCAYPAFCTIDPYHSMHAMTNLISNSLDSLAMCEDGEPTIRITIDASKEWISWSLYDNGVGLDNKSVKKLMMPFVSTKSKTANWGIGLPYVYRVITSQLGQIRMSGSTNGNNHYALVEVLLPKKREKL